MRELLGGLVPGPARTPRSPRSSSVPTASRSTPSRSCACCVADGRLIVRRTASTARRATSRRSPFPETLTALIASRLDALDAARPGVGLGRGRARAELHAGRLWRPSPGDRGGDSSRACAALVRRELLTIEADPRSPERGQYAFVQALIREVAYNTLARARPEGPPPGGGAILRVGRVGRAGGCPGRSLRRGVRERPRGRRGERARRVRLASRSRVPPSGPPALGAWVQAIGYYRQALEVTSDQAEAADLQERLAKALQTVVRYDEAIESITRAIALYRAVGDRPAEATAISYLAAWQSGQARPDEAIETPRASLVGILRPGGYGGRRALDGRVRRGVQRQERS